MDYKYKLNNKMLLLIFRTQVNPTSILLQNTLKTPILVLNVPKTINILLWKYLNILFVVVFVFLVLFHFILFNFIFHLPSISYPRAWNVTHVHGTLIPILSLPSPHVPRSRYCNVSERIYWLEHHWLTNLSGKLVLMEQMCN